MKHLIKTLLSGITFLLCTQVFAQITTPASLRLLPPDQETYYQLEANTNAKDLQAFRTSRGLKLEAIPKKMSFNNAPMSAVSMKLRGKTSLKYRRKSYRVELDSVFEFRTQQGTKAMDHFLLLSLTMDRGYYGNRLAFACLQQAGISNLYRSFTELKINGQSEGLYSLIQRPEDYAIEDLHAPYVLRRSAVDFVVADYKLAKGQAPEAKRSYDEAYQELIRSAQNLEGSAQFDFFNTHLDLDAYCTWLALNTWFQNGDYTDELLFYVKPGQEKVRFGIIPWDFDDVFSTMPHEDWPRRNAALGEKLLFSSEVGLDRAIANNPQLYAFYLEKMKALLQLFPEVQMRKMYAEIYAELYPYFKRQPILEMSAYDRQLKTDLSRLEKQMNESFQFLMKRRAKLLELAEGKK